MIQLVYISLLLIIRLHLTCAERKTCSTIIKSQRILNIIVCEIFFFSLRLCVGLCVYVHPPWRLHLSGSAGIPGNRSTMLRWRRWIHLPVSLDCYFAMQNVTFQLAALSCSYTRSRQSHDLTSIRLAFGTQGLHSPFTKGFAIYLGKDKITESTNQHST